MKQAWLERFPEGKSEKGVVSLEESNATCWFRTAGGLADVL